MVPAARGKDARRRAFTLVELLMVITVIAILMSITIGVVGAFLGQARETATTTTLSKIQSLMDSRRRAFDRLQQRKGFVSGSYEYIFAQQFQSASIGTANPYPQTIVKPLTSKLMQMKYFPQSAADLNFLMFTVYGTANQSPGTPAQLQFANMYPKLFQSFVNNPAAFVPPKPLPNLTNAEILYNVLTENVIGDSPLGTDSFSSSEISTGPGGLQQFQDGWQHAIRFYRWPTRLFRSGGTGATITAQDQTNARLVFASLPVFTGNLQNDLARDPDDPLQTLSTITNPPFENFFHTPATYHIPLIVSAGPDGFFGLDDPGPASSGPPYTVPTVSGRLAGLDSSLTAAQAQDQIADNIVSASIKAGGK